MKTQRSYLNHNQENKKPDTDPITPATISMYLFISSDGS